MLSFTAVVCTRNRSSWARQAVESLVDQQVAGEAIEVLVVDNGSADETPAVMRELSARHAQVRYLVEPVPGLARARNLAPERAEGDIVAFLDDDAVAAPHWAAHHAQAFEADAGVGATGGPIDLVWPDPGRPAWLPEQLESLYSGLDLGPHEHTMPEPLVPYGANMAVRASVVAEVGPFLVELGRSGLSLLSGEERELFDRIRSRGATIQWVPLASVAHHVLPDRLGRGWLRRRAYSGGRSTVLLDRLQDPHRSRAYWVGRAGFQAGRAAGQVLSMGARTVLARPQTARTEALAGSAHAAGMAREAARAAVHGAI